jgi:hypothetical protein
VDKRRWEHRNHWLSDYILQKTGAVRRRKQVGSRMQTLKKSWDGTPREHSRLLSMFLGDCFSKIHGGTIHRLLPRLQPV